MTQRVFFTKEVIIEAAFELTRESGWQSVSARSIARKLGSSTMPIYSSMKSMSEIEDEVRARAGGVLLEYQGRPYTEELALNKAVGYVAFARDERNLFRFLYVDRPLSGLSVEGKGDVPVSLEELTDSKTVPNLADQARVALQDPRVLKSWIFTHGLASMIGNGVLDLPDDRIRDLLSEAGAAFFGFEGQVGAAQQPGASDPAAADTARAAAEKGGMR
jgi:AcrR family transcriptional regulator